MKQDGHSVRLAARPDFGPPPVYVGFGSMTGGDPEGTRKMIVEALEQPGQRGVLFVGMGEVW